MAETEELAERGTAEFYREQAARLTKLAVATKDPRTRLELLDIASAFQKLGDRVSANRNLGSGAVGADSA